MSKEPQSFKNHARFDPPFHFFLSFVLIANVVFARLPPYTPLAARTLFLPLVPLLLPGRIRCAFPHSHVSVEVQDRVIRLEERLRLQALAPAQWHTQIYRLTEDQLIGLRFASDDEVVELAKQALENNLNRKQIKERIKNWRPDEWRV